ncbi:MAG: tetratricopeptide repeat protein [Labilithrix sp.]|nr:tetratricopeptide repeat protein [Labilithrix sp.]MCW5812787.1 tetratricopeptide repeat protein [Labilithrix sp.]
MSGSTVESRIADLLKRGSRDEQLASLCALGRELLAREDADGALVVADRAVRFDGRSPAAWTLRGEVLAKKNRAGEAVGCFDRALAADPANVAALVGKADLLVRLGSPAEALEQYEEAVKLCPEVGHLWLNRARSLESAGREQEALESIDRALTLGDAPATWLTRGNLLAKMGRDEDAKTSFARAVELDGGAVDAWHALALVSAKLEDTEGAKRACHRLLEAAKDDDPRVSAIRSLLFQLDRHGPQPPQLRRPPHRISSSRMRRVSRSIKAVDVPLESGAIVEPAAESDGDYEDTLAELISADALHRAGRHIEALRKVESLVKTAPKEANGWVLRARILLALGKPEVAAKSIEDALALDDRSVPAWKLAARAFADAKKYDRALDAVAHAERLAPNDGEVHRLRGDCLVAADRHTEAVYAFEKAVHYGAGDAESWLALGRMLRLLRRATAAKEPLEKARDLADAAGRSDLAAEARSLLARLG